MVEKLVKTVVARMTRGPPFNAKAAAAAGFRSLPPLTNGKSTGVGLSSLSGTRCSSLSTGEQPKRSVIALKNAPGPTVNSSGTGLFKTKSHGSESRGPRSRKRSRDAVGGGDAETLDSSDKRDETGSASELVEPTKRRRRGKGSKKYETKNTSASIESDTVLHRPSSSGLLDIYGLKTKTVDLTMYHLDIPLEKLLSGDFEVPQASAVKSDPGESDCRNLIERHLGNVMDLLPKRTSISKSLAEKDQEVKVRFMLDLERPFQPEEDETVGESGASSTTATSKPFSVQDLPLYTYEEFRQKLKLPPSDLGSLISSVCPTDFPGTTTTKSSKFEGIPPFPFSFPPCGIGDTARASRHGRSNLGRDAPDYTFRDNGIKSDRAKEEKTKDGGLRVKIDEERLSHSRLTADFPAMPSSPGVQEAALLLCNMANSDELDQREGSTRSKRYKVSSLCEQQTRRFSKADDRCSQEAKEVNTEPSSRKSPGMEKRKSLSQVNHSLSCKRPSLGTSPSPSRAAKNEQQESQAVKDRHKQQQHKSSLTKSTKEAQLKPKTNGLFDRSVASSSVSKPSKTGAPELPFKSSRRTSSLLETRQVRSKHDLRGSSSSSKR